MRLAYCAMTKKPKKAPKAREASQCQHLSGLRRQQAHADGMLPPVELARVESEEAYK